jgi:arylsulfatase A-like enzyme
MIMALYEAGVLENTVILFTADHGEMLFDHNLIAKGTPFDSSARLPFILHLPRTEPWRSYSPGGTIDRPVELRDLLPTFCDLAGVDVPDSIDGKSILALCRGETESWREYIHGEHVLARSVFHRNDGSTQWLTDGREKYIWFTQSGRELLFDLQTDPAELYNLSAEHPDRIAYWRAHLIAELEGREEGFVHNGELVVGCQQSATLKDAGWPMDR